MILTVLRYLVPAFLGILIGFTVQGWRKDVTISDLKASHETAIATSIALAHEETIRLQRIKDEAIEKANRLAQANALAANRAQSELNRMRDKLSQDSRSLSSATYESLVDYTVSLQIVFGECSAELTELARKADGHALDAKTLKESWGTTK